MCETHDDYYHLAERIKDAYNEIGSDIIMDFSKTDAEYAALREKVCRLEQDYPIENILEGSGAVSLTADEHKALAQYIELARQMEDMERRQIYFRGHTDCFSYLKQIGVI